MRNIILWIISCVMLTACSTPHSAASLQRVQQLYDQGLYGASSAAATLVVQRKGPDADAAAWYGGLAEIRRSHDEQARRFFQTARHASDPRIAGGAEAMLGQLDERRGDLDAALQCYDRAWTLLKGTDRVDTGIRALATAQKAGNTLATDRWAKRVRTNDQPTDAPFVLQAGAYHDRNAAEAHAQSLQTKASAHGHGPIQLRRRSSDGTTLWLVHMGSFNSRAEAAAARRRLHNMDLIVTRVSVSSD